MTTRKADRRRATDSATIESRAVEAFAGIRVCCLFGGGALRRIHLGGDISADLSAIPLVEMPQAMKTAFEQYFNGSTRNVALEPPLYCGTTFERRVWQALTAIPRGETWSYGRLAGHLGLPAGGGARAASARAASARAVGSALRKNPFPLVYPCHRVIMSDGKLGGFSCGIEIKRRLLQLENINNED
ncbi:MAG: methylated-DNA--[protein]-cysteine S-methyltransferase [Nitrospirae bacterium]|nr:methylated-DNA--[protein]-cysteine S-methyltransferase [Nitrospirota bacterium]